jgi:hypothetical protein
MAGVMFDGQAAIMLATNAPQIRITRSWYENMSRLIRPSRWYRAGTSIVAPRRMVLAGSGRYDAAIVVPPISRHLPGWSNGHNHILCILYCQRTVCRVDPAAISGA